MAFTLQDILQYYQTRQLPGGPGGVPGATPGFGGGVGAGQPQGPAAAPPVSPADPPLIKLGKWQSPSANSLLSNPQFVAGMGLLASGGRNPAQTILEGASQAGQFGSAIEARDQNRLKAQREATAYGRDEEQYARTQKLREVLATARSNEDVERAIYQYGTPEMITKLISERATAQYGGASDPTANEKNWKRWATIRDTYGEQSPEMEAFWRTFRTPATETEGARSAYGKATEMAFTANQNAWQMRDLADRFEAVGSRMPTGLSGTISQNINALFGSQDQFDEIRTTAQRMINREVLAALPPGPATDKDIIEAKRGFPPSNANVETLIRFFRGAAKIQEISAAYYNFRGEWMATRNNLSGMQQAWNDEYKRIFGGDTGASPVVVDVKNLPEE